MKICRFELNEGLFWGRVDGNVVRNIGDGQLPVPPAGFDGGEDSLDIADVVFRCPVTPSKIVCVGRNYADHAKELGNNVPEFPLLFLKAPSALTADGEPIRIPPQSAQVEHEGELGVVIGRTCKNLGDDVDPFEYVLGFVALNDVTARDIQKREVQFTRAKSFDSFCPVGRFIETDVDVTDIAVVTRVNGEVKQNGRTSQMVFPISFLIRYISNQMTLHAGDLIATGTPAGVSKLSGGDVCEVEIEGVGVLVNPVSN